LRFIANEIAWVSGWASDISIWEDEIYEHFPNYSHRFIDYYNLVSADFDIVPESEIVVGWSLGTLALLNNLSKKIKEQKWILVCPITNFCAHWPPAVVRATTPKSFCTMLGDVPKEEKEKWLENAMRYSPEQLRAGLDFLIETKIAQNVEPDNYLSLHFGTEDKIVPAGTHGTVYDGLGHWLPDYIQYL